MFAGVGGKVDGWLKSNLQLLASLAVWFGFWFSG
jgi:hypothetical protein